MYLFHQDSKPDFKKIRENTSKAQGVEHPEWINGFAGAFLFTLLDVYVTDRVNVAIEKWPTFNDTLKSILLRFKSGNYGHTTKDEADHNDENRWLSCSHSWTIGRYDTEQGLVLFEAFENMSLLYFAGEDISDVRDQQDALVSKPN